MDSVPQPSGSGAGEREALGVFHGRTVGLAIPPSLLQSLRDERASPVGVPFVDGYKAKVSAYAVFVSDMKAVKKAIVRYEQIVGVIIILKIGKLCG